jgi:hypothetical protein
MNDNINWVPLFMLTTLFKKETYLQKNVLKFSNIYWLHASFSIQFHLICGGAGIRIHNLSFLNPVP